MKPITDLREAVLQPADRDVALFELGMALDKRGEPSAAIAALREAAALRPDEPHYHLGLAWLLAHRTIAFEDAIDSGRRAFALAPAFWKPAGLLGWLLGSVLDRHAEAQPLAVRAVELSPEARRLHAHLCRTCLDVEGLDRLRARVEAVAPPAARRDLLHLGLADALMEVGRYDEALRLLQDLRRAAPDDVSLLATLAEAETALGDDDGAARHFARALELAPANAHAHANYLLTVWRSGDRDRITAAITAAGIATSGSTGGEAPPPDSLRGQTVLLSETGNGHGGPIHSARLAPMLQARGARAVLECREPVRALLETAPGASAVVVPHDVYPPFDQQWYPFSLPPSFAWTWDELSRVPYFDVPQAVRQAWAARVHAAGDGVHVGLDWRSDDEVTYRHDPYRRRTIPLRDLAPIITTPGTTCHTLTAGEAAAREIAEVGPTLRFNDVSTALTDFLHTAAAICALDVVVTADTAVAHLAGALAKPTFLLLPYCPDFPWSQRGAILGYPTVRPFRQPAPGDWTPVIAAVQDALRAFVRQHRSETLAT